MQDLSTQDFGQDFRASDFPDVVAVMVGVAVEGPYSYRVPQGMVVSRGSIVAVPLVGRLTLGVVWGAPTDMVAHNRLKDIAEVYDVPPLSDELLKLVDWVSRYTLAAPGMVLRGVLRSAEALEPERPITAFRATGFEPSRMTDARLRVLDVVADGMAWAKSAIVGASGVSPSVIEGLEKSGALERLELPPGPVVERPDPEASRGNRIYGCDDCQLICPWNKFAQRSALPDFDERQGLSGQQLVTLFGWSEDAFLRFTEGSPIRRIGHERWLRNIAVAMGNALRAGVADAAGLRASLQLRASDPSEVVREHVVWALAK